MKKVILSFACCSVLFGGDYFQILEKSYDIINLKNAKVAEPNIDGSGVVVGIVDTMFNTNHPSLNGKILGNFGYDFKRLYIKDTDNVWSSQKHTDLQHGSHVAGILLGNKLGENEPYGVASGAKFYGVSYNERPTFLKGFGVNLYDVFSTKSNVNIINHSYGYDYFPIDKKVENFNEAMELLRAMPDGVSVSREHENIKDSINNIIRLAKDRQILHVIASGNEGKNSPLILSTLPRYDEELRSIINVGALDSDAIDIQGDQFLIKVKKINEPGRDTYYKQGVNMYSNGFNGATAWSLMAPGSDISSANGLFDAVQKIPNLFENTPNLRNDIQAKFIPLTGTSQAAPMVSGVAALVSQKFQFLNGKQIADVLLSTANKNYELPKIVIKREDPRYTKYTVIYVESNVPNEDQIKLDLKDIGYDDVTIQEIVSSKNFISLKREDIMGQGILDAQKALKGLAVLDANRLNSKDIQTLIGKEEAYYTINTNGKNGEFSNNISQKQWDDNLHLATALNSPANKMKNLNVGFIKDGNGMLTFSGENSYKGATIVRGGKLNLKEGSKLTDSNVYVENSGTLSGNGEISKNLTNKGTVQVGSENDIKNLNIRGKYTQEGENSALILNFDKTGNSKLIASAYDIKSGKLQYRPLIGVNYAGGQEIRIGLGNLENQINNFTKVEILSTNTMDFKLNTDKLHINKQGMDVLPNTNVDPNANQNPNIIVKPEVKSDAFEVDNSDMGGVLRDIKQKGGLNAEYNDYFAKLDYVDKSTYKETLSSISSESYLANSTDMISTQYRSTQNNMLFALNPMSFTNILTANTLTEPVMLASIGDDTMTFKIINDSREPYKNTAFYLTPRFKKTNGDDYNAKSYGFDMGVASAITDGQILALSINYSKSDSDFKHADFDSKYANLGINYSADITKGFKILSGFGVGYGKTDFSRNVVLSNDKLNASYKNLFASAQLGVAKDFVHDELTITPLVYLNYNLIRQNAFNESGGLFAREYDKINHNTTSVSTGVNLNYIVKNEKNIMQFGGYALYERRLSGKKFDNKVKFKDFDNSYFTQKYELDANLFTLGLNSQFDFKNGVFTRLGLINEFSSKRKSSSILATFGYKF